MTIQTGKENLDTLHKWLYILCGVAVIANFSGLFVPLMDPDAGVYASVTRTMVQKNDYLNLYFQDHDWLDKPHFPFWVTAVFFKLFGIHDWSYKIPGILFSFMGVCYTYLFAKKYYNKTVALLSAFMLLTAMHFMISNNDVRAEPFLIGLIMASLYHFSLSVNSRLNLHFVAACFFAACAVMTKGPYTLIPIGAAVAGELIIKNQWKEIFHWRWLVALVLVALFISPELYSLWQQFDMHPEKVVFNKTHVSGIKFFLWDSQFGRFTNTGPIKGNGDPSFYLHTLLWAFLPWSLLMYAAIFDRLKQVIKKINIQNAEWYTLYSALASLFIFSISKFQLPYYTNIIFPMLAIITAGYVWKHVQSENSVLKYIQIAVQVLMIVLILALYFFYNPPAGPISVLLVVIVALTSFLFPFLVKQKNRMTFIFQSGLSIIAVNLFLNLIFYPDLLKYQSCNQAAAYLNKNYPGEPLARMKFYFPAGEFYLQAHTYKTDIDSLKYESFEKASLFFVTNEEIKELRESGIDFEILKEFPEFHITTLTLKFLNHKTREKQLKTNFLIRLSDKLLTANKPDQDEFP